MELENDELRYAALQQSQEQLWEAKCNRCGACCGVAEGDPCEHLNQDADGKYFCQIYERRFGLHKTVSGREFRCVPIRLILNQSWPGDHLCVYKQKV